MFLSGVFFLFIIITNIVSGKFGYKTFGDEDPDAKLQKINNNPGEFKISVVLILIKHLSIISLAVTLFITFNPFSIILGIVWAISRIVEALIQIYDKKNYWGFLNIATKYSDTSGAEKNALIDSGRSILKTKEFRFVIAQLFFSIGTISYSILFVTYAYEVVPAFIGWFGIVASILYGFGNGIFLIKPNFKAMWSLGGLLILLFEIALGVSLLYYSFIIP